MPDSEIEATQPASQQPTEPERATYLAVVGGQGEFHVFLHQKLTRDEVADQYTQAVTRGLEIHIFSLKPNPRTSKWPWSPEGAVPLRKEWFLYNATEDMNDDLTSIVNRLDEHSREASRQYLQHAITTLTTELEKLNPTGN